MKTFKSTVSKPIFSFGLSAILFGLVPTAFSTDANQGAKNQPRYECSTDECRTQYGFIFKVRSEGKENPVLDENNKEDFGLSRRVDIHHNEVYTYDEEGFTPDQKKVEVTSNMSIRLENGGMLWATEDPALNNPSMNINGPTAIAFDNGVISEPVQFSYYNNYSAFIERLELVVFDGHDTDLVTPLTTVNVPVTNNGRYAWDGKVTLDQQLVLGNNILYTLRAYDKDGHMDETRIKTIRLVSSQEKSASLLHLRDSVPGDLAQSQTQQQIANKIIEESTYGSNSLRQQTIPVYGSRVRIFGQDIPQGEYVTVNGDHIPVSVDGKFVAEYLMPVGKHNFRVGMGKNEALIEKELTVDVTGKYLFMVALADITASKNSISDHIVAIGEGDQFDDDFLLNGRLAFYLKGKVKGKYLITAQADTRERELEHLFDGFMDKDPKDVFRRLDPDRYYPVYGDDSRVYRDVDTQGKFYLRVDWDKSQAIWGNFNTGITDNEFAQYNRSLYGAAVNWRSIDATELGESKKQVKAFASQAQTAFGHNEFLGTGGSLYYLRNTDILPGSQKIVLEVRDNTTGRVEKRMDLKEGADYEIDTIQGRIILRKPLSQISREGVDSIIRDRPLDGFDNILLVDYEYLPTGFSSEDTTVGGRAKVWLGEHVAVGGTMIDENRAGDDYELQGVDVTLQAGRGTYLKVESASTKSNQAGSYFSDNGGFSFAEVAPEPSANNQRKEGDAFSAEARANFKELGWTENSWVASAWHRKTEAGYSVARRTTNEEVVEAGVEVQGEINDALSVRAKVSEYERGDNNKLEQVEVGVSYRVTPKSQLTAEVRQLDETISGVSTSATLGAVQYKQRVGESWDIYGTGQFTIDNDAGKYDNNDLFTLGTKYLFGSRSSVGAEYSTGHRGEAASLNADYYVTDDYSVYGKYTFSTDTRNTVFGPSVRDGFTLGQRWRVSNQVTVFNESNYLKSPQETGLVHTFGLDYIPTRGWNLGLSLQEGELEALSGVVNRQAATISGAYRSNDMNWSSKLEYRDDSGTENREQWLTTNRMTYRLDEDWRLAARINYSKTEDFTNPQNSARFIEGNLGFSYRPVDNNRWALLGRYTYLYDLRTLAQVTTGSDQKSNIFSLEGIYRFNPEWELAAKLARRTGMVRQGRGTGAWYKSTVELTALQVRYHLIKEWDALAEYRILRSIENQDRRVGWLIGVDYHISDYFKVGLGYNFTDFSDNLANLEYEYGGWFLNFVGKY